MEMLKKKYMHDLLVILIAVSSLVLVVSFFMMLVGIKKLSASKAASDAASVSVPVLTETVTPYTKDQYDLVRAAVDDQQGVHIDVQNDHLVISAAKVDDEGRWRHAIEDALSLDRHLYVKKLCGGVENHCQGGALIAEIRGEGRFFSVK